MALLQYNNPDVKLKKQGLDQTEIGNFNYHLEVEGKLAGVFYFIQGGKVTVNVIKHDIVFATGDSTTLMIPGTTSFQPVQLQRGLLTSLDVNDWITEASMGDIIQARRNGSIYVWGDGTKPDGTAGRAIVAQWDFEGAWPTSVDYFWYNEYTEANLAMVNLEIVVESITRVR